MTRSKFSTKVILLATGIGLSTAGFAGSQPAAAQSYPDEYTCPVGSVYDPTYGCTVAGDAYEPYDYGYYGYLPYGAYGSYYGGHREFGHGFGHGMAGGINRGVGFAHAGAGGFAHAGAGGFGHGMAGGFAHGMAGGFGHGGGHR
jgi:hypothetical protein